MTSSFYLELRVQSFRIQLAYITVYNFTTILPKFYDTIDVIGKDLFQNIKIILENIHLKLSFIHNDGCI